MHPDIERLADLQLVDLRLNDLRAKLAAFPKQLAEIDNQVAGAHQQLTAAKDALTTSLKERKTYEMDVESWKEKARKYRDQSAAVKTNEAYKALQHEIQHAEQEAAKAEDRLLERMMSGEEFERQVKAANVIIAEAEAAANVHRKTIQAEQTTFQKELESKLAERQQKVSTISEDLFEHYERIALRRHGVGLAEVRNESCSMCGVRIIPHIFQMLRDADNHEIFQCETCTRIFYYVEPPAAAPADAAGSDAAKSSAAGAPAAKS